MIVRVLVPVQPVAVRDPQNHLERGVAIAGDGHQRVLGERLEVQAVERDQPVAGHAEQAGSVEQDVEVERGFVIGIRRGEFADDDRPIAFIDGRVGQGQAVGRIRLFQHVNGDISKGTGAPDFPGPCHGEPIPKASAFGRPTISMVRQPDPATFTLVREAVSG